MKKIIILILTILILVSFIPINVVSANNSVDLWYNEGKLECPYGPGSAEWEKNEEPWDRKMLQQIPKELLKKIETSELIELVLKYPFLGDIVFYDTYQMALDNLIDQYNGIAELFIRIDTGSELLKAYKELGITDTAESICADIFIETMLAQKEIVGSLSQSQREELVELVLEKEKVKAKFHVYEVFGGAFVESILENDLLDKVPLRVTGDLSLLKSPSGMMATLSTPAGSSFTMTLKTDYIDDPEYTTIYNNCMSGYTDCSVIEYTHTSARYNCHYYALVYSDNNRYSGYKGKNYWLAELQALKFYSDGSYTKLTSNYSSGKIVAYWNSGSGHNTAASLLHSGVVKTYSSTYSNIYIYSKWGRGPLVSHRIYRCPYYRNQNLGTGYIELFKINSSYN